MAEVDHSRSASRAVERLMRPLADEVDGLLAGASPGLRGQGRLLVGYLATAVALGDLDVLARHLAWLLPLGGDTAAVPNQLLAAGELIAGRLPERDGAVVRDLFAGALERAGSLAPDAPPALSEPSKHMLAALLAGDRVGARRLAAVEIERGLPHLYENIVTPALTEVGRLWYERRISVAQEHLATALAHGVIGSFYSMLRWPTGGPRAVLACVGGEQHGLGARMAADLLGLDGWDVTFLGPDVPTDALAELVRQQRPALIALSVTIPLHLPEVRKAIAAARAAATGARVLVGGRGAMHATGLDADAIATSASQGVAVAAAWKPRA